ncbi:MAG: hypothetical protein ACRBI6_04635 [Acidimicrobiales bacterium]
MEHDTTQRGFQVVRFTDENGAECSLQQSSLAVFEQPGSSAVWLGPNDASPLIMCSQAKSLGVEQVGENGWQRYPVPDEVQFTTRMHLGPDAVRALITQLQSWLDTGRFDDSSQEAQSEDIDA